MKFAFIIMGSFDVAHDKAAIHEGTAQIIGVPNLEAACTAAKQLYKEGIDCIELCGAFGESGAKRVIDATENKVPIGYITHLPEQNELFQATFSRK